MNRFIVILAAILLLLQAVPSTAEIIDIGGLWIMNFPQGQGTVELVFSDGSPSTYTGKATLPGPGGPYVIGVTMNTSLPYLQPGKLITFKASNAPPIRWFMMNFSSSSSGVAWVQATSGAPSWVRDLSGVKASVNR